MDKAKTTLSVIFVLSIVAILISVIVFAKPDFVPATNNKAKNSVNMVIPAHAVQIADNVFSLGTAKDVDGRVVEGILIIHKKNNANPNAVCGDNICQGGEKKSCPQDCTNGGEDPTPTSSCFSVLAKGARWKTTEQYITGPGIDTIATDLSLVEWDTVADFDIFGTRNISGIVDGRDEVQPDGKNEVEFADLGAGNTVAVTITWGIFRGNPANRRLVEWDATFNNQYTFGDADNSSLTVMDYQNVATHEFGHSLGLGHPDDSCTEETMYRFVAFNETIRRTIEAGDIAGVNSLYS